MLGMVQRKFTRQWPVGLEEQRIMYEVGVSTPMVDEWDAGMMNARVPVCATEMGQARLPSNWLTSSGKGSFGSTRNCPVSSSVLP